MATARLDPVAITGETVELPKIQTMLEVSEKPSGEEAAATGRKTEPVNSGTQLDPNQDPIAGTSEEEGGAPEGSSVNAVPEYPKAWKLLAIVAALCLAVFLVALDQTIVATATPKITDHFHSLNDVGWYVCDWPIDMTTGQYVRPVFSNHASSGPTVSSSIT